MVATPPVQTQHGGVHTVQGTVHNIVHTNVKQVRKYYKSTTGEKQGWKRGRTYQSCVIVFKIMFNIKTVGKTIKWGSGIKILWKEKKDFLKMWLGMTTFLIPYFNNKNLVLFLSIV